MIINNNHSNNNDNSNNVIIMIIIMTIVRGGGGGGGGGALITVRYKLILVDEIVKRGGKRRPTMESTWWQWNGRKRNETEWNGMKRNIKEKNQVLICWWEIARRKSAMVIDWRRLLAIVIPLICKASPSGLSKINKRELSKNQRTPSTSRPIRFQSNPDAIHS